MSKTCNMWTQGYPYSDFHYPRQQKSPTDRTIHFREGDPLNEADLIREMQKSEKTAEDNFTRRRTDTSAGRRSPKRKLKTLADRMRLNEAAKKKKTTHSPINVVFDAHQKRGGITRQAAKKANPTAQRVRKTLFNQPQLDPFQREINTSIEGASTIWKLVSVTEKLMKKIPVQNITYLKQKCFAKEKKIRTEQKRNEIKNIKAAIAESKDLADLRYVFSGGLRNYFPKGIMRFEEENVENLEAIFSTYEGKVANELIRLFKCKLDEVVQTQEGSERILQEVFVNSLFYKAFKSICSGRI